MIKRKTEIGILIAILMAALCIRTWDLARTPVGFFCDEASIGYNAFTLLTTGKDEHAASFPIFFQSFGDYRPPIPFYAAIPFVAIFGLSEWSVRLTTAVIGTVTVYVMYLFIKTLFRQVHQEHTAPLAGLVAAGLLAISPWHIHFSRFGTENIYLPFFILLASWCFLESIRHPKMILAASLVSMGTCFTYLPGIVIGPIFFLCSLLIMLPYLKKMAWYPLGGIGIAVIMVIPVIMAWNNTTLQTRWNNVGIAKETMRTSHVQTITNQYIAHFSPLFLFTKGDVEYPGHFITRFGIRNQGQLYYIDAIFVILGIIWCIILLKKQTITLFPLLILFLYPIGSSITRTDGGGPLAFRSILGSIAFPMLSALGILYGYTLIRHKGMQRIMIIFLLVGYELLFSRYIYLYYQQNPMYSQDFWGWQYGARDIMSYFLEHRNEYDELYMPSTFNGPDIFVKFYDPNNLCEGKCRIGTLEEQYDQTLRQLFAVPNTLNDETKKLLDHFSIQKTLSYPNGTPAYFIGTRTYSYPPEL